MERLALAKVVRVLGCYASLVASVGSRAGKSEVELVLSLWHHHWDHERGDLIISTLPLGMFTSICSCPGTESDMIAPARRDSAAEPQFTSHRNGRQTTTYVQKTTHLVMAPRP